MEQRFISEGQSTKSHDISEKFRPDYALVMKGGAVKGLAYVGALEILERYYRFNWFVGTSAGAIAAVLLAAGYQASELKSILCNTSFTDFMDAKPYKWLTNLIFKKGLFPAITLQNWLEDLLNKKVAPGSGAPIRLEQLKTRCTVYAATPGFNTFNFDSRNDETKKTKAVLAVRASMAIPFVFQPLHNIDGRVYDGGLSHNYPLLAFLNEYNKKNELNVLGLYLGPVPYKYKPLSFAFLDLLEYWLSSNDEQAIKSYGDQTVFIDPSPVPSLRFNLNEDEKAFLLATGRAAALAYIARQPNLESKPSQDEVDDARGLAEQLRLKVKKAYSSRRRLRLIVASFLVAALGLGVYFVLRRDMLGFQQTEVYEYWARGKTDPNRVDIDVTLYEVGGPFPTSQYSDYKFPLPLETTLKYVYERIDDKLQIKYEMPYLKRLSEGGVIEPLEAYARGRSEFTWQYPALAVKVANNTNRTLFLTEAALEVISSEINRDPVLVIHSGVDSKYIYNGQLYLINLGAFHITNEGWGNVVNASVDYTASAEVGSKLKFATTKRSVPLGNFFDRVEIPVVPNIQENSACIREEDPAFVNVSGVIKYETEGHEHRSVRFKTKVLVGLCSATPQGALIASGQYSVLLEAEKIKYTKYVPIAQEVKPGDTDYFLLWVGSNKSAKFDLRLSLRVAGEIELSSKSILVDIFTPRSAEAKILDENDPKKMPNMSLYRKMKKVPSGNK